MYTKVTCSVCVFMCVYMSNQQEMDAITFLPQEVKELASLCKVCTMRELKKALHKSLYLQGIKTLVSIYTYQRLFFSVNSYF